MEKCHSSQITSVRPSLIFVRMIVLLLLVVVPATANTVSTDPLQLQAVFDNDYIHSANPGVHYLEVLVTAPENTSQRPRIPLNLALVIDTSGSMAEKNKLDYVKQAATAMLERLRPEDRFAIITYNNEAKVLFPSQSVRMGKEAQLSLINSLRPGGGTNLGAGLLEGYRQIQDYSSPATINRILLLSDGIANIGISSSPALSKIVLEQSNAGISLSSFGVGLDFNEELLAALSESGRGMYYFIDHPESMDSILAKEFNSVEKLAVADIVVNITLDPGFVVEQIFANNSDIKGNTASVRFGDLAAGERRRMQVRFQPRHGATGHTGNAARIEVSYMVPGSSNIISITKSLGLTYTDDEQTAKSHHNPAVSERSAVFEAHLARAEAAKAFDRGDQNSAQTILERARQKIETASVNKSGRVNKEISAIEAYGKSLSESMQPQQRALEQKLIKHKSHVLEGC